MSNAIRYSVRVKGGVKKWGTAWTNSLAYLGHPEAMQSLAKGYRYYINRHVPKLTGALRKSARPKGRVNGSSGSATIYWGTTKKTKEYAHYQFVGDVYGPNAPRFEALGPNVSGAAGVHSGWHSPKAKGEKYNTGRKMGTPFQYTSSGRKVVINGYTTPDTGYNWIETFQKDSGDFGETAVNIRAGRYMYELFCIKTHETPYPVKAVGGYKIYHSWRQIEKIRD